MISRAASAFHFQDIKAAEKVMDLNESKLAMEFCWSIFHKSDALAPAFHFHREAVAKTYKQLFKSNVSIMRMPAFSESISQAMEVFCSRSSISSSRSRLPHVFHKPMQSCCQKSLTCMMQWQHQHYTSLTLETCRIFSHVIHLCQGTANLKPPYLHSVHCLCEANKNAAQNSSSEPRPLPN